MTDKIIILKNVWSNYQFLEMLGLWRGEWVQLLNPLPEKSLLTKDQTRLTILTTERGNRFTF